MIPPDSHKEAERIAALHSYQLLDTAPEEVFDRITNIAKTALDLPISLITLVDKDRQWFKSKQGTDIKQTPRQFSFCSYAIQSNQPMIVENLAKDPRFADNPLVTTEPKLRFYCGVPLRTKENYNLGTLCVLGYKKRSIDLSTLSILVDLSRITIDEIELRHVVDIDYLTGTLMPRILYKAGDQAICEARLTSQLLGMIVFETDDLKKLIPVFGEENCEKYLKNLAETCKQLLPKECVFARMGNSKFAILMPKATREDANILASKLDAAFAALCIDKTINNVAVPCDFGIALCQLIDSKINTVYSRAEIAMQQAKSIRHKKIEASVLEIGATYSFDNAN